MIAYHFGTKPVEAVKYEGILSREIFELIDSCGCAVKSHDSLRKELEWTTSDKSYNCRVRDGSWLILEDNLNWCDSYSFNRDYTLVEEPPVFIERRRTVRAAQLRKNDSDLLELHRLVHLFGREFELKFSRGLRPRCNNACQDYLVLNIESWGTINIDYDDWLVFDPKTFTSPVEEEQWRCWDVVSDYEFKKYFMQIEEPDWQRFERRSGK